MYRLLKKTKIILFILIILLSSLFSFTGCTNISNIDDLGYVVALGLDVGDDDNNLKLSVQIAIPTSPEQGSDSPTSVINSINCSSIDSGINLINSIISKKINLSHCKVIVISEELAYKGIEKHIYTLINNMEVRPDTSVIVSKCSAEYYLNNSKPILEKSPARYYEVSLNSSKYTAYTDNISLREFFYGLTDFSCNPSAILGGVNIREIHSNNSDYLETDKDSSYLASEMPSKEGSNLDNIGLAVFKEDKLVGELTAIETLCHLIITNDLETCNISVPSPFNEEGFIDLELNYIKNTKTEVDIINGTPFIKLNIYLNSRIRSISNDSSHLNSENISKIEEYTNSYLESHIINYLYKTSKVLGADISCFGKYASKNFLFWNDWEEYNWIENYRNSFFDVKVNTKFRSSFLLQKT